jgi:HK97 family phage major capsid protein
MVNQMQITPFQNGIRWDNGMSFAELSKRPFNFKEFMEAETPGLDGVLTTDDLAYLMPEVINRQIITIIEEARIGRSLIDTMRINSESESFIKEYGFKAFRVEEGAEVPVAKTRYEKEILTTFKVGVRPLLTYEAIADGKIGILQRNILNATLAMARYEDAHIMNILNAGVPDGTNIKGTVESNHTFGATAGALTWDLLVRCYVAGLREGYTYGDIVCHPFQLGQFLKMEEFRAYDATNSVYRNFAVWNNRTEMRYGSGKVGQILGCNLWVSNNQPAGRILMIDRNNYGILAERQPLLVESEDDIIHQMHTVVFTQRYAAGILNTDGAAAIKDLTTSMP